MDEQLAHSVGKCALVCASTVRQLPLSRAISQTLVEWFQKHDVPSNHSLHAITLVSSQTSSSHLCPKLSYVVNCGLLWSPMDPKAQLVPPDLSFLTSVVPLFPLASQHDLIITALQVYIYIYTYIYAHIYIYICTC